jgi:hypothetical protein
MLLIRGTGFGPPAIGAKALSRLKAYAAAAPPGNFIVTDMSPTGVGQWKDWKPPGDWGLPFIWSSLHVFGGNDGIKGNMNVTNGIPFEAPPFSPGPGWACYKFDPEEQKEINEKKISPEKICEQDGYSWNGGDHTRFQGCGTCNCCQKGTPYDPKTQAVGVGYTPEGLDQNPAYYEVLQEAAFKQTSEANITEWLIKRAHRRYGLPFAGTAHTAAVKNTNAAVENLNVASAWSNIGHSGYANDGGVHDPTNVGSLKPSNAEPWTGFDKDKITPTAGMCMEWKAWNSLLAAAPLVKSANAATPASQKFGDYPKTYTYDLVDIGREVLAQLTIPVARNFSAAIAGTLISSRVNHTGALYRDLLLDLDSLLATDTAFMIGPWLASARKLGGDAVDCTGTVVGDLKCDDFMEWNARSQVSTWKPTPKNGPLGSPGDYARKHWSGLVSDYYATRVDLYMKQALADAAASKPFDNGSMHSKLVRLAYEWQTAFGNTYPTEPESDPVTVSTGLIAKWGNFFHKCDM